MQKRVKTIEETNLLAMEFVKMLKGGETIALIGDLGAGKTAFVRGCLAAMGFEGAVKSPTFTVMNEYDVDFGRIQHVQHLDLYRFTLADEIEAMHLGDLHAPNAIMFVEWPNVLEEELIRPDIEVRIEIEEEGRRIEIAGDRFQLAG
ncbi:MAG: tRNA (adenosine(37)-N6)-threonylcarbamoyltransferase complex ATPase subunit type 1 TsaE [bacterium]|nr:tRNA (adenosine(37)-N6)-threonylcarbamoyltransferase complex ATPase subunit type 1 TsaE [bacterium]